jgi:hypothetical protein
LVYSKQVPVVFVLWVQQSMNLQMELWKMTLIQRHKGHDHFQHSAAPFLHRCIVIFRSRISQAFNSNKSSMRKYSEIKIYSGSWCFWCSFKGSIVGRPINTVSFTSHYFVVRVISSAITRCRAR